jgi:hypothetical protein
MVMKIQSLPMEAIVPIVLVLPFVIGTPLILALQTFSGIRVLGYVYGHFPPALAPFVLPVVQYLTCLLPGLALVVKRYGWTVSLLVGIAYVPVMTFALIMYELSFFTHGI